MPGWVRLSMLAVVWPICLCLHIFRHISVVPIIDLPHSGIRFSDWVSDYYNTRKQSCAPANWPNAADNRSVCLPFEMRQRKTGLTGIVREMCITYMLSHDHAMHGVGVCACNFFVRVFATILPVPRPPTAVANTYTFCPR